MSRTAAVRRNTVALTSAHCLSQMGLAVLLIVAAPAAATITGHDWTSGLVFAMSLAAGAAGAWLLGRWMDQVGRRPGLLVAYASLAVAALVLATSIRSEWFLGILVGTVVFGIGTGGANLARGAVADMYPPDRRGRAVGILIAAGVVGAIGGPLLLVPLVREAAMQRGFDPEVAAWIIPMLGALAAFGLALALRPDPRDLAHADEEAAGTAATAPPSRPPRQLLALPVFRGALIAAAVAQMAMVGVMGVTPTELEHLGHGGDAAWVVSVHLAGMYAFAAVVGIVLDRWGRRTGILLGLGLTMAGAVVAASGSSSPILGFGLFAIGLGWSGTYLGVTAVISDVTRADERAGALGFTDLLVFVASATAALAGGLLHELAGYRALGMIVAVFVLTGLAVVAWIRERPTAVVEA